MEIQCSYYYLGKEIAWPGATWYLLNLVGKPGQSKRIERNKFNTRKGKSNQSSKNYEGKVRKKRARDSYWEKRSFSQGFQMVENMSIFKLHTLSHLPNEIWEIKANISTDACKYSRSGKLCLIHTKPLMGFLFSEI